MQQAYPVVLTRDGKNIIAEFPDVPEAMTVGADKGCTAMRGKFVGCLILTTTQEWILLTMLYMSLAKCSLWIFNH
jgi:hypothetical protein